VSGRGVSGRLVVSSLLRRGAMNIFGEGVKRGRDMGVGTGDKSSTILMVLIYILP
jgi:hypothetical protein